MAFGRLMILDSDGRQATVTLDKPTVRIGSAADNDVVLHDATVDPYHAQLLCDARGCQLLDLGSMGGTFFNGVRLSSQLPVPLADDSVIQIGGARITISLAGQAGRGTSTGKLKE